MSALMAMHLPPAAPSGASRMPTRPVGRMRCVFMPVSFKRASIYSVVLNSSSPTSGYMWRWRLAVIIHSRFSSSFDFISFLI